MKATIYDNLLLDQALACKSDNDRIDWVQKFLNGPGKHPVLAEGLELQPRWWMGPLMFPLNELERNAGPEENMAFACQPDEWEQRTLAMTESLERGWTPPPLIVEYFDNSFVIADGNCRYDALLSTDTQFYWIFIWTDNYQDFLRLKDLKRAA